MRLSSKRLRVPAVVGVVLSNTASPLISVALAPILARELSLSGRGRYAALTSLIATVPFLLGFGLQDATTYFVARFGRVNRAIRRVGFRFGLLATLIWIPTSVLLYLYVYRSAGTGVAEFVFVALAVLFSTLLFVPRGEALGLQKYAPVNAEKYISSFLRLVVIVALAVAGALNSMSAVLTAVFLAPAAAVVYTKDFLGRPVAQEPEPTVSEIQTYARHVWAGTLSGAVVLRLDQIILIALIGSRQLAFYAIAVAVSELPVLLSSSIRTVYLPRIAGDFDLRAFHVVARIMLALSVVIAVGGELTIGFLVPFAFGHRYVGAVPSLRVLLIGTIPLVMSDVVGTAVTAKGQPRRQAVAVFVAAVVTVLTLPGLAVAFGAFGASIASAVSYLALCAWLIRSSRSFAGSPSDWLLPRPSDLRHLLSARKILASTSDG